MPPASQSTLDRLSPADSRTSLISARSTGSQRSTATPMAHPGAGTRAGAEGDPSQRLRLFISGAAQSQRLTAKYQSELHAFQQFLMDLQPDWWRVLVLQQATTYRILDAQERLLQNITELQTTVQRLEAQVAEHFFINKDMADEAVAICRRLILDGRREDYTQSLSNEVIELLKDTAKYPHFADVWKSESQKKQAITMVNNKATDVRKEYRVALVTLTNPLKKSSLSAFIRDLIRKSGWSGEFTPEMALRVAVLRQFVRDHAEELDTLDRDDEGEGDYSRPNKRQKRAVRSRFFLWAEFQHWLKGRIREWGRDIRSGGWAAHIEACLRQERREFPEDELSFIPQAMQTSADAVSPPFPGDDFYEAPNSDLAHLAPLNLTPVRPIAESRATPLSTSPLAPVLPHRIDTPSGTPIPAYRQEDGSSLYVPRTSRSPSVTRSSPCDSTAPSRVSPPTPGSSRRAAPAPLLSRVSSALDIDLDKTAPHRLSPSLPGSSRNAAPVPRSSRALSALGINLEQDMPFEQDTVYQRSYGLHNAPTSTQPPAPAVSTQLPPMQVYDRDGDSPRLPSFTTSYTNGIRHSQDSYSAQSATLSGTFQYRPDHASTFVRS